MPKVSFNSFTYSWFSGNTNDDTLAPDRITSPPTTAPTFDCKFTFTPDVTLVPAVVDGALLITIDSKFVNNVDVFNWISNKLNLYAAALVPTVPELYFMKRTLAEPICVALVTEVLTTLCNSTWTNAEVSKIPKTLSTNKKLP